MNHLHFTAILLSAGIACSGRLHAQATPRAALPPGQGASSLQNEYDVRMVQASAVFVTARQRCDDAPTGATLQCGRRAVAALLADQSDAGARLSIDTLNAVAWRALRIDAGTFVSF